MDILYIIIPAYNESANIKQLIDDWYPIIEKYDQQRLSRLVIVNDGSTDNTHELVMEQAKTRPLLVSLTKKNGGHGSALMFGYMYALAHKPTHVFQTDSDGQTDPKEFAQFWNLRDQYDAIIGNRPSRQDGFSRKLVEKVLRTILWGFFGVKVPDANAPYRLMKKEILGKYLWKLPENYNLPNAMLTTYFAYFHENIKFIDISFKPRQSGKNTINFRKILLIGWKALHDMKQLRQAINNEPA